ncbi:unnamed protein product [Acanthosepion pharaonis]|uniref:Uncharacterized protein n=1 Tax=Acanthosepion pharaonis TaxID=158019 RepID=A0A812BTX3_ACAPH|nr:unnamed protein product [Sepia pharaonis]
MQSTLAIRLVENYRKFYSGTFRQRLMMIYIPDKVDISHLYNIPHLASRHFDLLFPFCLYWTAKASIFYLPPFFSSFLFSFFLPFYSLKRLFAALSAFSFHINLFYIFHFTYFLLYLSFPPLHLLFQPSFFSYSSSKPFSSVFPPSFCVNLCFFIFFLFRFFLFHLSFFLSFFFFLSLLIIFFFLSFFLYNSFFLSFFLSFYHLITLFWRAYMTSSSPLLPPLSSNYHLTVSLSPDISFSLSIFSFSSSYFISNIFSSLSTFYLYKSFFFFFFLLFPCPCQLLLTPLIIFSPPPTPVPPTPLFKAFSCFSFIESFLLVGMFFLFLFCCCFLFLSCSPPPLQPSSPYPLPSSSFSSSSSRFLLFATFTRLLLFISPPSTHLAFPSLS